MHHFPGEELALENTTKGKALRHIGRWMLWEMFHWETLGSAILWHVPPTSSVAVLHGHCLRMVWGTFQRVQGNDPACKFPRSQSNQAICGSCWINPNQSQTIRLFLSFIKKTCFHFSPPFFMYSSSYQSSYPWFTSFTHLLIHPSIYLPYSSFIFWPIFP